MSAMQKQSWILFSLLAATGCGSSSSGSPTETPEVSCSGSPKGATRCNGTAVEICDATGWTQQEDCAPAKKICSVSSDAVTAACVTPAGRGDACQKQEQCASGLTCSIAENATSGMCLGLCDPAAGTSSCETATPLCAPISEGHGLCEAPATAGGLCVDSSQCPAEASSCQSFRRDSMGAFQVPVGVCAVNCAFTEINKGRGSCPAGFDCLMSPWRLDTQLKSGSPLTCAQDPDCDTANGYTCVHAVAGGQYCARAIGVCGHVLPLYSAMPDIGAAGFDPSTLCSAALAGQNDYRNFCGTADATATVKPTCVSYNGYILSRPYAGLCVATCTPGVDVCGAGYTCATPPPSPSVIVWDTQLDGQGQPIVCSSTTTSTCAAGYTCAFISAKVSTPGLYCARPKPVCTKA